MDISRCDTCKKNCPQANAKHNAATGRMYAMRELAKIVSYWDAISDENGNPQIAPDRLRELVEADKAGRCFIAPIKVGERVFLPNDKKEIIECRVQGISLPVHGKNLIIHLGGYPAEYLWTDREGVDWWKTREAAEAALKGERNGKEKSEKDSLHCKISDVVSS